MSKKACAQNAALVVGSLIFSASLLVVAEVVVRFATDVTFLGNSANLFVANSVGSSKGNAKNVSAVALGVDVYTDANGFRVGNSQFGTTEKSETNILVIGDSVGFGVGVEYEDTFAGRLEAEDLQTKVFNSSVIGYRANDYKNVTDVMFSVISDEIDSVILIFCLNDVSSDSAQNIDAALRTNPTDKSPDSSVGVISPLPQITFFEWANDELRSRSKLYVLAKGVTTAPQFRS